jgi:hypothetical protein
VLARCGVLGCALSLVLLCCFDTASQAAAPNPLSTRVLALSDLPTGSTTGSVGFRTSPVCSLPYAPPGQHAQILVSFMFPGGFDSPVVQEELFSSSKIGTAYRSVLRHYATCKRFNASGTKGSGSAIAMVLSGAASRAFRFSITFKGSTITESVVVFRVGSYAGAVLYIAPTTSTTPLRGLAEKAVLKLKT